jgi:hypothetical protein
MQHMLGMIELQRVAGIGASLEAGDQLIMRCEHIHYFSFAFISPLQAQQNVSLHIGSLYLGLKQKSAIQYTDG